MKVTKKDQRKEEALQRQAERNSRTDEEQLALLDARGFRAEKERAKLQARIEKAAEAAKKAEEASKKRKQKAKRQKDAPKDES